MIGLGMLFPRTAKLALAASLPWAIGVWCLGEGLSGLASGHASLLSGAPGSVSLYGVLALAAWPRHDRSHEAPARWLPLAWAVLWVGAAIFQALPARTPARGRLPAPDRQRPHRAGSAEFDTSFAGWTTHHGTLVVVVLAAAEVLIGLAALYRRTIAGAAAAGLLLALAIWVIAQNFGQLYTGQATDPNTAPLIALMAVGMCFPPGFFSGSRAAGDVHRSTDGRQSSRKSRLNASGSSICGVCVERSNTTSRAPIPSARLWQTAAKSRPPRVWPS